MPACGRTRRQEDDTHKLVHAINTTCPEPRDAKTVDRVFAALWPQLDDDFADDERLAEVLNAVGEAEIPLAHLLSRLGGPPIGR